MKRILKQLGMNKTGKSKELLDYIFFNLNKIKNKTEDENIEFIFFTQYFRRKNTYGKREWKLTKYTMVIVYI